MFRLTINSQKHGIVWQDFSSEQECVDFINSSNGHWGHSGYTETRQAIKELQEVIIQPEVLDELGNIITPAVTELQQVVITPEQEVYIEPTYSYTIEDRTLQMNQESAKKQALKYLADTDWYIIREMDSGVVCPADIKTLRAQARLQIM